ncbi:MAG: APC family permease, partial [Endozoicomonadaceae bacterium]|nr:APC family permease [Endozoicomonadaceae bacterium]
VFLFSVINLYVMRAVIRLNNMITFWKLLIPIIVIAWIGFSRFNISNFTQYGGFVPFDTQSILWAIPSAGIIFSFLGFRECISLAGEAKNPERAIPIALIGSVTICVVLYVALQIIFIGALTPDMLSNGWGGLTFSIQTGPLASIAIALGMGWLAKLIYIDALISPAGSGIIYTATTARLNYSISTNKYLPAFMMHLTKQGIPVNAIAINFVVGVFLLAPLPTWQKLVEFQSTAILLSYGLGPVCLIVLRKNAPELKRPFVLPKSTFFSMMTFYICTMIVFWTGWNTMRNVGFSVLFGLILMLCYRLCSKRGRTYELRFWNFFWFILYLLGLTLCSWLGSFGGGLNIIPFGYDFVILGVFSVIIFIMALYSASDKSKIQAKIYNDPEYIDHLKAYK